jgi:hypothetical protein
VTADLHTLRTALYVELTDRIIPRRGPGRPGPGRPPEDTDTELVCLAVTQVHIRLACTNNLMSRTTAAVAKRAEHPNKRGSSP